MAKFKELDVGEWFLGRYFNKNVARGTWCKLGDEGLTWNVRDRSGALGYFDGDDEVERIEVYRENDA